VPRRPRLDIQKGKDALVLEEPMRGQGSAGDPTEHDENFL
jgi:hypothetical protein